MRISCTLLALCALAGPAAASPLEMFGVGARSPALGATGVASADDYDCIYLNPAGLGALKRKRFSAGTLLGGFDLNGVDRTIDAAVGLELGGALPIPLGGPLKDRLGMAIGIYIPGNLLNRARAPRPGTPFYALLENRSQSIGIQVGVGIQLTERWSAGVGLLALAALRGHIAVTSDPVGRFTTVSEQQLISDFAPILGARWRATDDFTLGATLRFTSQSSYDIQITTDLGSAIPVTLPELRVAGVAQYDPLTVAVEAAWRVRPSLLVALQVAGEHWSDFPLPTENPVTGMTPQAPPDFHDTLVPRLGVEWTPGPFALRAGYFFAMSPAPDMTGQQALIDNHRHVLSAGVGGVSGPLHIDAWFQAHLLVPRHTDRPGTEPDVDTSGSIFVGGLQVGVDL